MSPPALQPAKDLLSARINPAPRLVATTAASFQRTQTNESSVELPEGCPKTAGHIRSYQVLEEAREAASQDPELRYSSFVARTRMEAEIYRRAKLIARFYQEDCAEAFLLGINTGLITATGSGKTEAFLLPLLADPEETSKILIISTLNALEVDQAKRFNKFAIAAEAVNGETYNDELHKRLESNRIRAIITSPEMVFKHPRFSQLMRSAKWTKNLIGTVIDEAHCMLEWGKEFRRDFDDVEKTCSYMSRKPILFCTATLTPSMLDDLLVKLGFPREKKFILNLGNERHNVTPVVCRLKSPKDFGALDHLLDEAFKDPPQPLIPTLIYSMIWLYLIRKLPFDSPYRDEIDFLMATRDDTVKTLVLEKFLRGFIKILAATESAGMGIDVPGMPRVYQFGIPCTLVEWQQHAGRACRSGEDAYAVLLVEPSLFQQALVDGEDVQYRKKVEGGMRDFAITEECRREITIKHFNGHPPCEVSGFLRLSCWSHWAISVDCTDSMFPSTTLLPDAVITTLASQAKIKTMDDLRLALPGWIFAEDLGPLALATVSETD
ncbi:P-loop containing nucleoside triphosphate hydrolase protein, partial [Cytidiella melzeri]